MDDFSPYRSPAPIPPEYSDAEGADREEIRRVAEYQRSVIYALLANIAVNILAFSVTGQGVAVRVAILVLSFVVVVFAVASIFLLAREIINTVAAVLCALLMIVPCISLLVLVSVNQRATTYLQKHGVKVGFFGARADRL